MSNIKQEFASALIKVLEFKDIELVQHSIRVMKFSIVLGKYIGCAEDELDTLKYAAILHDIGKMVISKEILGKKESLSKVEFEIIKSHPNKAYEFMQDISIFKEELDIIIHHHERIDGKGYPHGINGSEISKLCKIVSICDAFDAMISRRVYKKPMSIECAIQELISNADKQFDSRLSNKFIEVIKELNINKLIKKDRNIKM